MPGTPKISVVLVSWNGRRHLEECLPALFDQDDPGVPWEVVVLDNGSTDGTASWLEREHPHARLVRSPVNLGFCAGNNRAVAAAAGEWVALLNNDTRPYPGWLSALAAALGDAPADVAAVSGKIVDWEGERLDFARGVTTFDGHAFQLDFRRPLGRAREPAAGEELPFACGGNMLVRKSVFEQAGGFDEAYFAYLEDVDLGWRLWARGQRVVYAPEAVVRHRSSATSDLLGMFHRGFLFERNAYLTAYKNYEPGLWERVMPAVLLTLAARTHHLLVHHNPGGATLALDPYAGHIANTGATAAPLPAPDLPPPADWWKPSDWARKWREHGGRELARRVAGKLRERLSALSPAGSGGVPEEAPRLTDPRTVSQLRAMSWILSHLDDAAASRERVQASRVVSDREILERFPRYLVPTYPGDETLFASDGFRAFLPADLPLVEATLAEIMEL